MFDTVRCKGSVTDIVAGNEIGQPSLKFSLVSCLHFHTITFDEGKNSSLLSLTADEIGV